MAAPYLLRPGQGQTTANAPLYYTFQRGGVRIIVLNTEEPYHPGSTQHSWLATQMRTARLPASRAECPWLIVQMHRPVYSASAWYENTREAGTRKLAISSAPPSLVASLTVRSTAWRRSGHSWRSYLTT